MGNKGGIGVSGLEKPLAELFLSVYTRKHSFVARFVLDDSEVRNMTAVVFSTFKIEEHQAPTVGHIIINRYVVIEEVIVGLLNRFTGHHRLQITLGFQGQRTSYTQSTSLCHNGGH